MAAKHPAGEGEEPVAGIVDELVPGGAVASAGLLDESLELDFVRMESWQLESSNRRKPLSGEP